MSNYETISSEPVGNAEVKEIIENKESARELYYREEKAKEYLNEFTHLSKENFEKAKEELNALEIPRLGEEHIIKILDIMPSNGTELRAITSHSGTVLVDENVSKILEVLDKYR